MERSTHQVEPLLYDVVSGAPLRPGCLLPAEGVGQFLKLPDCFEVSIADSGADRAAGRMRVRRSASARCLDLSVWRVSGQSSRIKPEFGLFGWVLPNTRLKS
jgi:hypothetical protein